MDSAFTPQGRSASVGSGGFHNSSAYQQQYSTSNPYLDTQNTRNRLLEAEHKKHQPAERHETEDLRRDLGALKNHVHRLEQSVQYVNPDNIRFMMDRLRRLELKVNSMRLPMHRESHYFGSQQHFDDVGARDAHGPSEALNVGTLTTSYSPNKSFDLPSRERGASGVHATTPSTIRGAAFGGSTAAGPQLDTSIGLPSRSINDQVLEVRDSEWVRRVDLMMEELTRRNALLTSYLNETLSLSLDVLPLAQLRHTMYPPGSASLAATTSERARQAMARFAPKPAEPAPAAIPALYDDMLSPLSERASSEARREPSASPPQFEHPVPAGSAPSASPSSDQLIADASVLAPLVAKQLLESPQLATVVGNAAAARVAESLPQLVRAEHDELMKQALLEVSAVSPRLTSSHLREAQDDALRPLQKTLEARQLNFERAVEEGITRVHREAALMLEEMRAHQEDAAARAALVGAAAATNTHQTCACGDGLHTISEPDLASLEKLLQTAPPQRELLTRLLTLRSLLDRVSSRPLLRLGNSMLSDLAQESHGELPSVDSVVKEVLETLAGALGCPVAELQAELMTLATMLGALLPRDAVSWWGLPGGRLLVDLRRHIPAVLCTLASQMFTDVLHACRLLVADDRGAVSAAIAAATARSEKALAQTGAFEAQMSDLASKYQHCSAVVEQSNERHTSAIAAVTQSLSVLRSDFDGINSQIEALKGKVQHLGAASAADKNSIAQLGERVRSLAEDDDAIRMSMDSLLQRLAATDERTDGVRAKSQAAAAALAACQNKFDLAELRLRDAIGEIRADVDGHSEQIAALQAQSRASNAAAALARSQPQQAVALPIPTAVTDGSAELPDLSQYATNGAVKSVQSSIREITAQLGAVRGNISELRSVSDENTNDIAAANARIAALEAARVSPSPTALQRPAPLAVAPIPVLSSPGIDSPAVDLALQHKYSQQLDHLSATVRSLASKLANLEARERETATEAADKYHDLRQMVESKASSHDLNAMGKRVAKCLSDITEVHGALQRHIGDCSNETSALMQQLDALQNQMAHLERQQNSVAAALRTLQNTQGGATPNRGWNPGANEREGATGNGGIDAGNAAQQQAVQRQLDEVLEALGQQQRRHEGAVQSSLAQLSQQLATLAGALDALHNRQQQRRSQEDEPQQSIAAVVSMHHQQPSSQRATSPSRDTGIQTQPMIAVQEPQHPASVTPVAMLHIASPLVDSTLRAREVDAAIESRVRLLEAQRQPRAVEQQAGQAASYSTSTMPLVTLQYGQGTAAALVHRGPPPGLHQATPRAALRSRSATAAPIVPHSTVALPPPPLPPPPQQQHDRSRSSSVGPYAYEASSSAQPHNEMSSHANRVPLRKSPNKTDSGDVSPARSVSPGSGARLGTAPDGMNWQESLRNQPGTQFHTNNSAKVISPLSPQARSTSPQSRAASGSLPAQVHAASRALDFYDAASPQATERSSAAHHPRSLEAIAAFGTSSFASTVGSAHAAHFGVTPVSVSSFGDPPPTPLAQHHSRLPQATSHAPAHLVASAQRPQSSGGRIADDVTTRLTSGHYCTNRYCAIAHPHAPHGVASLPPSRAATSTRHRRNSTASDSSTGSSGAASGAPRVVGGETPPPSAPSRRSTSVKRRER